MDIVTRLKMFLEQTGISNSQFADTCVIPRPTLSQLLNGRNKKVSDEVIAKIHRAYPTLNVMWLMFGDGEMLLPGSENTDDTDKMSSTDADAQSSSDEPAQRAISFEDDAQVGYHQTPSRPTQRLTTPSSMNEVIQGIMRNSAVSRGSRGGSSAEAPYVVSVMILYSDGHFERYEPPRP